MQFLLKMLAVARSGTTREMLLAFPWYLGMTISVRDPAGVTSEYA
jgi:hypothetical protein